MAELSKSYQPQEVECKWYQRWLEADAFRGDETSGREAYSIVIPPPNVTGILHLGHVLNNTIQDILARRARQQGKAVLWLPGTDHAGIATQSRVEAKLRKEGTSRRELGREKFLAEVWKWKEQHGGIIISQLQRLGCSCDWSRERFTMDPAYSRWISRIFVDLFNSGLIYRGKRMVNWCPVSLTALSDEEVIMKPQRGKLYYMRYKVAGTKNRWLEIATTRPETLMGDTAVAVHPKDERYKDLIGKFVWRPFPEAKIPIIAEDSLDPEFGTGVLKVTPAHDKADFAIGQRHNLPIIDIFHPDGTLNALAGPEFEGMDRFEARKAAAKKLEAMGQLVRVEDHENAVGYSERADVPIEPRISMQWFLRYPCVPEATNAVDQDEITFRPERWKKTYLHWMENIQDWCISRQLWWGHQIPVWYRKDKAASLREAENLDLSAVARGDLHCAIEPPSDPENWVRDEDVLDTWFSSWLWPFATMCDSDQKSSPTLKKFYPTSDLVTGPDILFFWVARMIMAGYYVEGQLPFRNVYYTSIIRDRFGRKLSKSLGNSPDPLDIIQALGADALRYSLLKTAPIGSDVRFHEERAGFKGGEGPKAIKQFDECVSGGGSYPQVEEGRNFATKIWNAANFRLMQGPPTRKKVRRSIVDIDILAKLDTMERQIDAAYADYRFSQIAELLHAFFWGDYCDWYIEAVKGDLRGADPARKSAVLQTMDTVFGRFLQHLHPFMPHLTEELWESLGFAGSGELLMLTPLPQEHATKGIKNLTESQAQAAALYQAVNRARNLKAEYNLAAKKVRFLLAPDPGHAWITGELATFALLSGASSCDLVSSDSEPDTENAPAALTPIGKLYMPLAGLIDVAAEKARLDKELEKIAKELAKSESKLTNENFVANAKPEVVQLERDRLNEWKDRHEQLLDMIRKLG
ncbi:MAG: valyl-tRNA synthetase [Verrucomicrobia bacterium]|nr:MAG: valyl-tRNA synthetase [Verrucomicrobiota bacterium]